MARTLIATNELIVGENHPNLPDTKNRYGKELWAAWLVEHTPTGEHASPYNVFPIPMHGSVTGTGAAQTITWPVDTLTEVLSLSLWTPNSADIYMVTGDSVPNVKSSASELPQTDRVTAMDTDGFTLGTAAEVNTAGVTCFYFALGLGTTTDAGLNNDPPDWIQYGTALIGGDGTASGNSVEYDLDTKFQVEHSEEGVHTAGLFDNFAVVEQGEFVPTGSTFQQVPLTDVSTVQSLLILPQNTQYPILKTASMPIARALGGVDEFDAGLIELYDSGFSINGGAVTSVLTPFWKMVADYPNNSTTFIDESAYAHQMSLYGSSTSPLKHSTDTAKTGTSSIKKGSFSNIYNYSKLNCNAQSTSPFVSNNWQFDFAYRLNSTGNSYPSGYGTIPTTGVLSTVPAGLTITFLFTKSDDPNALIRIIIDLGTAWKFRACLYDSTTKESLLQSTTSVNDSTWHEISFVNNNTVLGLYIDGTHESGATTALSFGQFTGCSATFFPFTDVAQYLDDVECGFYPTVLQTGTTHHFFATGT